MARDERDFLAALFVAGPALAALGLISMRKKRLIEALPCSRVRSAAMGLVELQGRALARRPQTAPFSELPCCFWRATVEELVDSGKNRRWVTLAVRGCVEPFFLEDKTGRVLVDPDGAELHGDETELLYQEKWAPVLNGWGISTSKLLYSTRTLRVREFLLVPHTELYVLGELALRVDQVARRKERFQQRLAAVKRDPARMAQADADKDGRVDVAEWDAFRLKVEEEFLREEGAREEPADERIVVRKPADEPFIISTRSESQLLRSMGLGLPGALLGVGLTGLAVWWAGQLGYSPKACLLMSALGVAVGAFVAWRIQRGGRIWG